jgi:hypothetical protein
METHPTSLVDVPLLARPALWVGYGHVEHLGEEEDPGGEEGEEGQSLGKEGGRRKRGRGTRVEGEGEALMSFGLMGYRYSRGEQREDFASRLDCMMLDLLASLQIEARQSTHQSYKMPMYNKRSTLKRKIGSQKEEKRMGERLRPNYSDDTSSKA